MTGTMKREVQSEGDDESTLLTTNDSEVCGIHGTEAHILKIP